MFLCTVLLWNAFVNSVLVECFHSFLLLAALLFTLYFIITTNDGAPWEGNLKERYTNALIIIITLLT